MTRLGPRSQNVGPLEAAIRILRVADETKAREFYCHFPGFWVDFEHRFQAGLPLYLSASRSGLTFHLSEHHGDATPGSTAFVPTTGLRAFQAVLTAKACGKTPPGIERQVWVVHLRFSTVLGSVLDPASIEMAETTSTNPTPLTPSSSGMNTA